MTNHPADPIQPNATRIIDLTPDEDALWGDLRKKWRQYVNKARTGGITVSDAGGESIPEFYRIYRETADRAGFNPPERPGWRFPGPHLHWDSSIAPPMPCP